MSWKYDNSKKTETMMIIESKKIVTKLSRNNFYMIFFWIFFVFLMNLFFWNEAFKKTTANFELDKAFCCYFLFIFSFSCSILSKVYRLLNLSYGSLIYCSSHNSLEDLLHKMVSNSVVLSFFSFCDVGFWLIVFLWDDFVLGVSSASLSYRDVEISEFYD